VSATERLRRQQLLREAEGYLDLLAAGGPKWPVAAATRNILVERTLRVLEEIPAETARAGELLLLRGQALRMAERPAEAIGPLRDAAELEPENLDIWLSLGWCYKRVGRIDLAVEAMEEALGVAPEQALVHYNLACYWALARNVSMSVEYLTHAFDLDPNYRDLVADEPDFDAVRRDPEFQAVLSVIV
jgi:Flp pilus assembly protein TadD